jgi:GntR family transcriptional regulator / MocR family aminotransferase
MPMNESSAELLVSLLPGAGPLRRQLATAIASAIRDGRLQPQSRLPSSRHLAAQLGVSRGVVTDAYAQLAAQGFLETQPRVAPLVVAGAAADAHDLGEPVRTTVRYDFTSTTPDVTLFPRQEWRRALERAVRVAPDADLDYGDHHGSAALRAALAARLGRTRGVVTTPRRLVVVQGFAQGLDVVCATLIATGKRRLAIEDPALRDAVMTARQAGVEVIPVPVDGDGIDVAALTKTRADAVLVTPAHQFPTGVVLTPDRRRALLHWARTSDALVIEDDYDAEFRHDGPPVGTLQGLAPDHVVFIGTASKTLAPGLRLGWLALPQRLATIAADAKWWRDSGSPILDQLALADLITSGAFDRSLRRALRSYRARRNLLVSELRRQLPQAHLSGAAAGLHLVVTLHGVAEHALINAALERGVRVEGVGSFRIAPPPDDSDATATLLLGYGRLAEPAIADAVALLAEALSAACQRRRGPRTNSVTGGPPGAPTPPKPQRRGRRLAS